jgi:hypothetical protein
MNRFFNRLLHRGDLSGALIGRMAYRAAGPPLRR